MFPRRRPERRGKGKIERDKHLGNRCGHAIEGLPACSQNLPGAGFESFIVEHPCEAQEIQGADRVRRGLGAIVVFLQTERNQRIAGGTAEIAPSGLIPEKCVLAILQLQCPLQPIGIPRRLVKVEQALDEERVILCKPVDAAGFATPASQEPAVGSKIRPQKFAAFVAASR